MNPNASQPGRDGQVLVPLVRSGAGTRISDRVYNELAAAIRDLRLAPGASLSETELARALNVSRTPLREAIARLVDNGLVSVIPQVGTTVELIRLSDVEQAQFVRESLEVAAFIKGCRLPERDVSALRAILEEQRRAHAVHDVDAFFDADERLHEQLFQVSGSLGAWRAMQPMKLQLDRLRRLSLPDPATVGALIDEHVKIVDALEAGDARGGKGHIVKHLRRVRSYGPELRRHHPELFTE